MKSNACIEVQLIQLLIKLLNDFYPKPTYKTKIGVLQEKQDVLLFNKDTSELWSTCW